MSSVTNTGTNWYFCAAPGCSSDDRKKGKYAYMQNVQFFAFPSKKKASFERRKWIELLRRDNFDPSRKARVCSLHFVDGKPTEKHPFPELFQHNNFKESKKVRSNTAIIKREQAIDTEQNCEEILTTCDTSASNDNEITPMMVDCVASIDSHGLNGCWPVANEVEISEMETASCNPIPEKIAMDHNYTGVREVFSCVDSSTQTDLTMTDIGALEQKVKSLDDPDKLLRDLFVEKLTKDDSSIRQYTGIPSKKILDGAFDILDRASPDLKYWSGPASSTKKGYQSADPYQPKKTGPKRKLSRYQEFLITLVRLRLALTTFLLGDLFGVSSSRVSQIFTTWINYMAVTFTPLLKWPYQDVIKRFRPASFKLNYPNVTGIIDCTEFFIKKPRNPTAQSQTFSSYKQHNTFKALVCISPSGAITYISKLWGGKVSDRYITKDCGFMNLIRPGDEIMADRGFLIRDLLLKKRAKLIIPPFTKRCALGKGKRLSASGILKTRNIARFRIHVERAIGRLKTFRMLSNTIPLNVKPLANQMITVCAFLCNMQGPLVKKLFTSC